MTFQPKRKPNLHRPPPIIKRGPIAYGKLSDEHKALVDTFEKSFTRVDAPRAKQRKYLVARALAHEDVGLEGSLTMDVDVVIDAIYDGQSIAYRSDQRGAFSDWRRWYGDVHGVV